MKFQSYSGLKKKILKNNNNNVMMHLYASGKNLKNMTNISEKLGIYSADQNQNLGIEGAKVKVQGIDI